MLKNFFINLFDYLPKTTYSLVETIHKYFPHLEALVFEKLPAYKFHSETFSHVVPLLLEHINLYPKGTYNHMMGKKA